MSFEMPKYHHPDFTRPEFVNAPDVTVAVAQKDGVAPEYYHSTSMYPEYFKINGNHYDYCKGVGCDSVSKSSLS